MVHSLHSIDVENYAEAMTHLKPALHPIDVENYDASPNIILISSDDENDDEDEDEKDPPLADASLEKVDAFAEPLPPIIKGIPGAVHGFLSSGRGGGNHKKKDGGKSGKSQHAKLDDNSTFPKLSDLAAPVRYNLGSHEEQIVSDNRKGTTPMHESDVSIDANDPSTMNANVVNS
ncbi:hypothetical protein Tco_1056807, partial [Tanacetum coccineum]